MKRCFETRWSGTPDRPRRNSERSDGGSEAALRRRPITTESIGSAATHPSLRGALATKQSRGHNMRGASNPDGRTAAPGLLRFARNDGQGIGSLVSACRLTRCLVPDFDGAFLSHDLKEAPWDKFYTAAPPRRRQSVEQYKIK